MEDEMDFLYDVAMAGDEVIAWAAAALVGLTARWLLGYINSTRWKEIVGRAIAEVRDAVGEVWQTYVSELKKANADGKLTDVEKAEARAKAIRIAKRNIGAAGLQRLQRIFGGSSGLEEWLGTKVEAEVAGQKLAGKAAKNGAAAVPLA